MTVETQAWCVFRTKTTRVERVTGERLEKTDVRDAVHRGDRTVRLLPLLRNVGLSSLVLKREAASTEMTVLI